MIIIIPKTRGRYISKPKCEKMLIFRIKFVFYLFVRTMRAIKIRNIK